MSIQIFFTEQMYKGKEALFYKNNNANPPIGSQK